MGIYVANQLVKLMIKKHQQIDGAKVLVLGITFKENCPDIRNSRVIDVIHELREFGCDVDVYDPWADPEDVKREYGLDLVQQLTPEHDSHYDAIVMAVAHDAFRSLDIEAIKNGNQTVVYDIKGVMDPHVSDGRL